MPQEQRVNATKMPLSCPTKATIEALTCRVLVKGEGYHQRGIDMATLHRNGKQNVSQDEIIAALLSKVSQLEAKLESKEKHDAGITCKVGEKGNLCIYGLGRFPVSLYASQFDKLAKNWDKVVQFVADNRDRFTTKD